MFFSGFPLTRRCRGDTRDRLREAEVRPKRYRCRVHQLTNERVKLSSLRLLAEDDEALNHQCEHQPRTSGVVLAATGQPYALFIKDCKCAIAIVCVSQLPEKCSDAESLDRDPWSGGAGGLGMQ